MMSSDVNTPLLLYRDEESQTARAAHFPPNISDDEEILFRGRHFQLTGGGLVFWDFLTTAKDDIVGFVLVDFEVEPALENSSLLKKSTNVIFDGYGYKIRLANDDRKADADGAQAMGSALFQHQNECLLYLRDWHQRGYDFEVDSGLVCAIPSK